MQRKLRAASTARPGNAALGALVAVAVLAVLEPHLSRAACNIIPGTTQSFRGASGIADRPFAGPGDIVELRQNPLCNAAQHEFGGIAAENVVTLVFQPPAGSSHVVILSASCAQRESERQRCAAQSGVASATCVQVNQAGQPVGLEVFERNGTRRLRFRFPDTDELVDAPGDGRTLSGPLALAVSAANAPLPCDLAALPCLGHEGLLACIDSLFATDGTCGTAPAPTFANFTALPLPNDYQALCVDPVPPCLGTAAEVRFTTDRDGNVLLPMDWRGILVGQGVPIARLLRGSSSLEAFVGIGEPVRIPSSAYLSAHSPEGAELPPVFDPQADPTAVHEAVVFGSADAPTTVLRLARRSPTGMACVGGSNAGEPCAASAECAAGVCGPAAELFDFSNRFADGVGPVIVPRFGAGVCQDTGEACAGDSGCAASRCVRYRLAAKDPVPLEGLNQTRQLSAFVVAEAVDGVDLNGDGDTTDDVVLLSDRMSGVVRSIGAGVTVGRAVVRIRQLPFSFPALAVEGGVAAFLESEVAQGYADANGNGRVFDSVLRAFTRDGEDLTAGLVLTADAAPLVNERSLAVAGGRVYFRRSEPATARQITTRSPGTVASADGRYVVFASAAADLVEGDTNGSYDVFVRDSHTGANERISVSSSGAQANGGSWQPAISADGGVVAFWSAATNLVPDDSNKSCRYFDQTPGAMNGNSFDKNCPDVFVRDRDTGITTRVSVSSAHGQQGGAEFRFLRGEIDSGSPPSLSADGRIVAFGTPAKGLTADDLNQSEDVFVRDRVTGQTQRASLAPDGSEIDGAGVVAHTPIVSGDGRWVFFGVANSTEGSVFAYDRGAARSSRLDLTATGLPANTNFGGPVGASADGRLVAFIQLATNLVPGDTNGQFDVFVRDREQRTVERVSVGSAGEQQVSSFFGAIHGAMSDNGRYVAFVTDAPAVTPDDTFVGTPPLNACSGRSCTDVFLRDRLTGATALVSRATDGQPGDNYSGSGLSQELRVSGEGPSVWFDSLAANLDPDGLPGAFVRGPDWTDAAADFSGDGRADDAVLSAFDTATSEVATFCPAETVVVAGDAVAWLRPEAAGEAAGCPPGPDLDGDGDAVDLVVHLSVAQGPAHNLGRAATALALSPPWLVALVSEAAQGGADRNGDGDAEDAVVEVWSIAEGRWLDLRQAADAIGASNGSVAFITPEAAQGGDLNGDGDMLDRVVQVYDASGGRLLNLGLAAEELVFGETLLAFRTSEAAQGAADLNGDGDSADYVLQVYDLISGQVLSTGQAVIPCRLEACDPRVPYRVQLDTLKFLTLESQQAEDLNGDGDAGDLVLQTFNVRRAQQNFAPLVSGVSSPRRYARTLAGETIQAEALTVLGAAAAGICTNSGEACASDAGCPAGTCFVPPGQCVLDLGTRCSLELPTCGTGRWCEAVSATSAHCHETRGACRSDGDCAVPARCRSVEQSFQRLVAPLTTLGGEGEVFVGAGRCVESTDTSCTQSSECAKGWFCEGEICRRAQQACRSAADCSSGAICRRDLLVVAAGDGDGDEIADPFDNCPKQANVLQEDRDGDGVGDACAPPPPPTATPSTTATLRATSTRRAPPPPTPTRTRTAASDSICLGDCDRNGLVTRAEVAQLVRLALAGSAAVGCVGAETTASQPVTVERIVAVVADETCSGNASGSRSRPKALRLPP